MLIRIYSIITQIGEVARVAAHLLFKWPFGAWTGFWLTHKPETVVRINGIMLAIRTKNIFTKSADISMAYECISRDDYQLHYLMPQDNSFILDIGSHIGSFSLAAAKKFPKAKVLSFEPSPENYGIFRKNIKLNKLKNIRAFNKAVSSKSGSVKIHINSLNSAANSLYDTDGKAISVSSVNLGRIFKRNRIKKCSFAKVDCEGAEYEILLNTPKKILGKIETMIIEYHDPEYFGIKDEKYTIQNLVKYLESSGFRCTLKRMKHYQGVLIARR